MLNSFLVSSAAAKKSQVYACQQADGSTVIQDRRCQVTQLQQVKVKPKQSKSLKQNQPFVKNTNKPTSTIPNTQSTPKTYRSTKIRSPYFTFGWDEFIPKNWQMLHNKSIIADHWLLSKTQFNGAAEFNEGVKLEVYPDTMRRSRQEAFAQALVLYHRIRDNQSFKLLDSQFKAHDNYKVFNIKYLQPNEKVALTEFYIDESHNDLFVITVQARQTNWQLNWQLAESIVANL
jgi:hypothetical protein